MHTHSSYHISHEFLVYVLLICSGQFAPTRTSSGPLPVEATLSALLLKRELLSTLSFTGSDPRLPLRPATEASSPSSPMED
jgi:hypothetical protein